MAEVGRRKFLIIIVVGVLVLAAIIIPVAYFSVTAYQEKTKESAGSEERRVNCFPEANSPAVSLTRELCQQRGCQYDPTVSQGSACYYSSKSLRYSASNKKSTQLGFQLELTAINQEPFGQGFVHPVLDVQMLSNYLLRLTFDDSSSNPKRYRVPVDTQLPLIKADQPLYEIKISEQPTFSFQVIRKSTGKILLSTVMPGLVLSDQFLQMVTMLPSTDLYGLGEHARHTFRHQFNTTNSFPAFARDQPPGADYHNLYGVHPFYTCVEDAEGNTHGVFLLNSNAQEYILEQGPMFTWRTIGGVLDFYVFLGPSPENVIQQYTEMIGRPMMPPYWALGFQLCRYGYNNLTNLQRAVQQTLAYDIPLDVQYADIDHMDERKIFTVDNVSFSGLNEYFLNLRSRGMRTIIILDPCIISNETGYEPYDKMKRDGANIKWPVDFTAPANSSDDDRSMLGYVWPKGKVVFPDYFQQSTRQVWKYLIVKHHLSLVFDGLWIDMNEPANFDTNLDRPWNWPEDARPYWSLFCANNTWDEPPYRPLATYVHDTEGNRKPLADKTLCMNGEQGERGEYKHYDVHNLYGWSQTQITLEAAREATGERSVVISRSTFPGSGKYAGHWLGDNTSLWGHLRDSIIGMLDFNLFGIPYVGADICGFFQNTTEELCLRWMQLGAFYPFSRNHNGYGFIEQHPGVFGEAFGTASREILQTRYSLLPYLYTLFHQAHTQGNTVVRPLHHEFPADSTARGIDRQMLWGPALLISPILEEGQTALQFYVPHGRWYEFYQATVYDGPRSVTIPVSYYSKPQLMLRGGYIIPTQRPANNTAFSRLNPFSLNVMLSFHDNQSMSAKGSLFWDDGVSIDSFTQGNYFLAEFYCSDDTLAVNVLHNNLTETAHLLYGNVIVYGVTAVRNVTISSSRGNSTVDSFEFNQNSQKLNVTLPTFLHLDEPFTVTWK